MSQVFFFSYANDSHPLAGLRRLMKKSAFVDMIPTDESVAVKLNMGELGNIRYIRPVFVRTVVDVVRGKGGRPFLTDTVVSYPGARDTKQEYLSTAAKNGFVESSVNAPVVITDDDDEQQTIAIKNPIGDCHLKEAKVPSLLLQSACIIVLSHVKGHELTGFGGALKNLGMGCVSTETKRTQHSVNMPQFNDDSDCDGCGKCTDACPPSAISLVNARPERAVAECTSCGTCLFRCPSHCWVWPAGAKEKLQVCLGHAAAAVATACRGRIAFVNFIQDVVPLCDCAAASGNPVVQDVGIAFSFDPVAIDKASLDLIDQAPIVPGSTSAKPPDLLGKMHHTSSLIQIETAAKLNIGTPEYDLVSV
ncbi:MAG: DUF362 domain-containing protein [Dehalococcoidia bacterium]